MLKPRIQSLISGVVLAGVLSSCASIVSKSSYPVTINSTPSGATFVIKDGEGQPVSSGTTPASVVLRSSAGYFRPASYTVEYKRNGQTQTVPLEARMNGWYLGNIVFGGLIGILIVDPATGAMWSLPERNSAQFAGTASTGERELKVMNVADVPAEMKGSLVALR